MTAPVDAARPAGLARSMALMSALTAVSRATGFVRIVVVAAVLGTTFLGNVYQSANTVPNVVFELVVAGVVQAVLIPALVLRLDRDDPAGAEHLAGAVLGLATLALVVVAAVGALVAPWLARALFAGAADPGVRAEQARLGAVLLWFFLPQVVCYGAGLVATSVLNAHDRFTAGAVAPLANNVVVIAACAVFWRLRDGAGTDIDLTAAETWVLAGGTTLGVVAFCGLPVLVVLRSGFRLRPNLDHRHPEVRRLARQGAWAGALLASTQLLLVTVLVLGNRVEGGVVAYQVGFQFFLLPYALFALPVLTGLFPTMSRRFVAGDEAGFADAVRRGVRTIAYLVAGAAALLGALGGLVSRGVLFGETTPAGAAQVAGALAGFAPGLVGYALFLFASRVSYARGDTRTPALVSLVVVVAGSAAMVLASAMVPDRHRVTALAAGHSFTYLVGAAALLGRTAATGSPRPASLLAEVARPVAAASAVGAVLAAAVAVADPSGRAAVLAALAVLGAAGTAGYLVLVRALGGPAPGELVGALRTGTG
ncbi:MAG TPA: lipid II flippase MurJ [Aquihabitans sp.]|nr:lipid II flippase MurJ [Aquihabitans sp.]